MTSQPGGEWGDDVAAERRMGRPRSSREENGETTEQPGGEWGDHGAAQGRMGRPRSSPEENGETTGRPRSSPKENGETTEQPGQQNGQDGTHVASALPLRRLLLLRLAVGFLRVPGA